MPYNCAELLQQITTSMSCIKDCVDYITSCDLCNKYEVSLFDCLDSTIPDIDHYGIIPSIWGWLSNLNNKRIKKEKIGDSANFQPYSSVTERSYTILEFREANNRVLFCFGADFLYQQKFLDGHASMHG